MKLLGLQKLTLLDFPEHVAAIVFLGGCNFRCPFCQNSSLVLRPSSIPEIPLDEFCNFLKKRQGILEGICITGGEPTLHPDLPDLLSLIRSFGYRTKLDTNGTNPDMLQQLLKDGLLDYVAMDIKAGRQHYAEVCGLCGADGSCDDSEFSIVDDRGSSVAEFSGDNDTGSSNLLSRISRSVRILMESSISFEFRTTVVKGLHTEADFLDIRQWIADAPAYYLQSFRDCEEVLVPDHSFSDFTMEEMQHFLSIVQEKIPTADLRGL